jgi:hypothetical protein
MGALQIESIRMIVNGAVDSSGSKPPLPLGFGNDDAQERLFCKGIRKTSCDNPERFYRSSTPF